MTDNKNSVARVVISSVVGLVLGAIIGFPSSFLVGLLLVRIFKVSSFEGGSGYAVLATMLIGIPVFALGFSLVNGVMARKKWPKILIYIEVILALGSIAYAAATKIY